MVMTYSEMNPKEQKLVDLMEQLGEEEERLEKGDKKEGRREGKRIRQLKQRIETLRVELGL